MAAALPLIKIVGVALSAKSAIEGIKEGNFFKSVLGGIGAYYGLSSLATPATEAGASGMEALGRGAENAVDAAGASIGEQLAAQGAKKGIEMGGSSAFSMTDAIGEGLKGADIFSESAGNFGLGEAIKEGAGNLVEEGVKNSGFSLNDSIAQGASWLKDKADVVMDPVKGFAKDAGILSSGEKTGLLSKGFAFAKDNPEIMQTGMNLVGGYMQGKAEEDMYDDQKREYYKSLSRRGYWAPTDEFTSMTFNPQTRRYE